MDYNIFMNILHIKAAASGAPLSCTFELTPRCTLNCKMCYIHSAANDEKALYAEKSTEWWLNLAKKLRDRGNMVLLLTGGEPMIRPDFDDIYTDCVKNGQLVNVNTNATLISDARKDMFAKLRPQRLNISLYGASEAAYEKLCGNGKMFGVVKNNITELAKAGIKIRINFSMTEINKDELEAVREFSEEQNIPMAATSYMYPPARACSSAPFSDCRFTPERAAEEKLRYSRLLLGDDVLKKTFESFQKGEKPSLPERDDCDDPNGERIRCRAGKTSCWVTFDGRLTPCGVMEEPSAVIGDDFDKAWEYIREARNGIFTPSECAVCPKKDLCDVCAAVCRAETGSFSGVPEYVCRLTDEYHRLLKQLFD